MTLAFLCYHQGLLGTGGDRELLGRVGAAGGVGGSTLAGSLPQLEHSRGPQSGEAWEKQSRMVSESGGTGPAWSVNP